MFAHKEIIENEVVFFDKEGGENLSQKLPTNLAHKQTAFEKLQKVNGANTELFISLSWAIRELVGWGLLEEWNQPRCKNTVSAVEKWIESAHQKLRNNAS